MVPKLGLEGGIMALISASEEPALSMSSSAIEKTQEIVAYYADVPVVVAAGEEIVATATQVATIIGESRAAREAGDVPRFMRISPLVWKAVDVLMSTAYLYPDIVDTALGHGSFDRAVDAIAKAKVPKGPVALAA